MGMNSSSTPSEDNLGMECTEVERQKVRASNKTEQCSMNKVDRQDSDITVSLTENSTRVTTESDLNHQHELSIQRKKKSVTFNEQSDIFLIPTRQEIEALIKAIYYKNMGRYVRFNKVVTVFPIPSRNAFNCIADEIWYNKDEIASMEKEVYDSL